MNLPGKTVLTFAVYVLSCNFLHAQEDPQDELGANLTDKLDGTTVAWQYEAGRAYELRLEDGMLTYRRTNGRESREWRSLVPYHAHEVGEGQYMVGWQETDFMNYVTLFIDLANSKVYSSALLGNYDWIHFQEAEISSVQENWELSLPDSE